MQPQGARKHRPPTRTKPTIGIAVCCARAASGHAAPLRKRDEHAPPSHASPRFRADHRIGFSNSAGGAMSALGQKQTCAAQNVMSALPPIADVCSALVDVR